MDTSQTNTRVFIATVPKAGKNVLNVFMDKLGFERFGALEWNKLAQCTYVGHFHGLDKRATWALPAQGAGLPESPDVAGRFLQSYSEMPDNSFITTHAAFVTALHQTLCKERLPIVFLYRDPRDILLSMANYYISQRKPPHLAPKFDGLSLEETMTLFLEGDKELVPFAEYLQSFSGWLGAGGVLSLRFEDIVGPLGGGDAERQYAALKRLAEHVNWTGDEETLRTAVSLTFSTRTGTFFKGQIGGWRESFSKGLLELFNAKAGHLLKAWGYEAVGGESGDELRRLREEMVSMLSERERYFVGRLEESNERYVALKANLAEIQSDSDGRLALAHKLEARCIELENDSAARLAIIRKFEALYKKSEIENAERLALINKLDALYRDSEKANAERLALIQKLDALYRKSEEESAERLAVIRKLEARITELEATRK
jgi:hypothetical protein